MRSVAEYLTIKGWKKDWKETKRDFSRLRNLVYSYFNPQTVKQKTYKNKIKKINTPDIFPELDYSIRDCPIHDLDTPTRLLCESRARENIKKYGLDRVLNI